MEKFTSGQDYSSIESTKHYKLGFGFDVDYEEIAQKKFNVEDIRGKANVVDCDDPRAQKCYRLLWRSLSDEKQAVHGLDEVALDHLISELISQDEEAQLDGTERDKDVLSRPWWDLSETFGYDPYEWPADKGILTPLGARSIEKGIGMWEDYKVQQSSLAAGQIMSTAERPWTTGDVFKIHDYFAEQSKTQLENAAKKNDLRQMQANTSRELVGVIDLALAIGDYDTYQAAMTSLELINPSAHSAVRCLAGTHHITTLARTATGTTNTPSTFMIILLRHCLKNSF